MNALKYEPATYKTMMQLQGRERVAELVADIEHEARVRQDPNLKAERWVKVWNGLEAERENLRSWEQTQAREKVEARMQSMAGELKGDAQLESVLRSRQRELGIAPGSGLDRVINERNIERDMAPSIGRDRGRGMGR